MPADRCYRCKDLLTEAEMATNGALCATCRSILAEDPAWGERRTLPQQVRDMKLGRGNQTRPAPTSDEIERR
jgi:hypothetical protein